MKKRTRKKKTLEARVRDLEETLERTLTGWVTRVEEKTDKILAEIRSRGLEHEPPPGGTDREDA